jgi:hypothetical protein
MNPRLSVRRWWPRLLLLIVLVGAGLRFVALDTAPYGIFHDEAWSAAKARDLLTGEVSPQVYFPENNGMDALHVYVIAAILAVTGPLAIGSRLASALIGTLTILATYWLAWEWWPAKRDRHALALAAAFVGATLFSALTTSRSGWHSISMALCAAVSLAALLRARHTQARRWFVATGVLVGLAQYAYPSARFIPVLVAIIGVADVTRASFRMKRDAGCRMQEARSKKQSVHEHLAPAVLHLASCYGVLIVSALIVFAPLGAFFLQQPEWLFVRAQQVTKGADLLRNTLDTVAALVVRGDQEGLHNLAGRPLLDPILAAFAVIGLLAGLRRKSAGWIALLALIVFSLPALLTTPAPLTRRWTGVWPIVSLLIAAGAVGSARALIDRWPGGRRVVPIGCAALLGVSAAIAVTDYFGPYVSNPQLFWAYDSGITQAANYMKGRPDAAVFLTPYDKFYEVVRVTLAEAPRAEPIHSYNGAACALFPETTRRVTEWVVIDEKDQRTLPLMQQLFPAGQVVWNIASPVGPYAKALQVPANQTAQLKLEQRDRAVFGGLIQLIGFEMPPPAPAGEVARVRLALKSIQPLDRLYAVYVHLRAAEGAIVGQGDRGMCDGSLNEADWRPGDVLLQDFELTLPPEAGRYSVVIGLYDEAGARLPVSGTSLTHTADGVTLGEVEVGAKHSSKKSS